MGAAGIGGQAKNLVDCLLMRLRASCLPDMHSTPIATSERGGDALLAGQRLAQRIPAFMNSFCLELQAHGVHEVVSQYADEQVSLDATFYLVINRA